MSPQMKSKDDIILEYKYHLHKFKFNEDYINKRVNALTEVFHQHSEKSIEEIHRIYCIEEDRTPDIKLKFSAIVDIFIINRMGKLYYKSEGLINEMISLNPGKYDLSIKYI
jgi:hypothetical protein